MHKEKIKNLVLVFLVLMAVYLSSQTWLKFDVISISGKTDTEQYEDIYLWDKIRPSRISISEQYEYYVFSEALVTQTWRVFLDTLRMTLKTTFNEDTLIIEEPTEDLLKIHFDNPIPTALFTEGLGISNQTFSKRIQKILWIGCSIEGNKYYYNDGENTYSVAVTVDQEIMRDIYRDIKLFVAQKYNHLFSMSASAASIPVSEDESVYNPVFVKSEIDFEDTSYIESIAKDYFKEQYDYVRKTMESSGNINYIYRNEKVLRIYNEGLLEFYDSLESTLDDSDVHRSFIIALNFIEDFLGFPENAYLSNVVTFSKDGKYGYRFIFSYLLFDRPVIFSQIREEKAMQVDVIGSKVVYYQRFIRDLDDKMETEMQEVSVISPGKIMTKNIDFITTLYLEDENHQDMDFEQTKEKILNSIYEIQLAYFDPSRKSKDQLLRSVWVFKTFDRQYVFNAITGAIIEEQMVQGEYSYGLE